MFEDPQAQFVVVVNHEEQYSLWPQEREVPLGWRALDVSGSKEECLTHIERIWTDMRPLSLRRHIDGLKATSS